MAAFYLRLRLTLTLMSAVHIILQRTITVRERFDAYLEESCCSPRWRPFIIHGYVLRLPIKQQEWGCLSHLHFCHIEKNRRKADLALFPLFADYQRTAGDNGHKIHAHVMYRITPVLLLRFHLRDMVSLFRSVYSTLSAASLAAA